MARWMSNGREIGGLLRGAAEKHARASIGLYSWEEFPIRRIRMRNEFRFPEATTVLMTLILIAVVRKNSIQRFSEHCNIVTF
jgi:hypothetical protein